MEMLSVIKNDKVRNELTKFGEKNKISDDEVICSIVYEFAKKLPYSMDYMDKDFVPGLFLNLRPENPSKRIFKDYSGLYYKMIDWGDTKKSGILLQICNIFQAMLMGQFPSDYQLTKEDFHTLGIDQMTSDDEYNRFLFETLEMLPQYCARLNSTQNSDERRKILDEIYAIISYRIGPRIGGFRRTIVDDDIISIQKHEGITLSPYRDLEMLYHFEYINFGFDVEKLIDSINEKIGIEIKQSNGNMCLESENKGSKI